MEEHDTRLAEVCSVVREISSGLIHANLGGGVFKQRVSGAAKESQAAFDDRANLTVHELGTLKRLAREMLGYDDQTLAATVESGKLEELQCDDAIP